MRLLHSDTLKFAEFYDSDVPPYAILSHTWGAEEVIYQEMKDASNEIEQKAGYKKILKCAELAKSEGYDYFWVDTCCIDKSSSAELSEAINSMFRWYKKSGICFAFLEDFSFNFKRTESFKSLSGQGSGDVSKLIVQYPKVAKVVEKELKTCRWMTRGWTLQELIAPTYIRFYGREFAYISDKKSLLSTLSAITGIPYYDLRTATFQSTSMARRLSWAAHRKTSRVEDRAYSLLGIVGVNMPLLYGEAEKAFVRLQEEIIRHSDDQSIFAWRANSDSYFIHRGLLAHDLEEFSDPVARRQNPEDSEIDGGFPFSITNKGICMTVLMASWSEIKSASHASELKWKFSPSLSYGASKDPPWSKETTSPDDILGADDCIALINCKTELSTECVGILLIPMEGKDQYARVCSDTLMLGPSHAGMTRKTISVRQNIRVGHNFLSSRLSAFEAYFDPLGLGPQWTVQGNLVNTFPWSADHTSSFRRVHCDVLQGIDTVDIGDGPRKESKLVLASPKQGLFTILFSWSLKYRDCGFTVVHTTDGMVADRQALLSERVRFKEIPLRPEVGCKGPLLLSVRTRLDEGRLIALLYIY